MGILGIWVIIEAGVIAMVFYARITGKTHKKIRRAIVIRTIFILMTLISLALAKYSYNKLFKNIETDIEKIIEDSPQFVYSELIEEISFQKILVNGSETDWELIMEEGLRFMDYTNKSMEASSPCQLLDIYYSAYSDPLKKIKPDEELLYKMIDNYAGTGILLKTDESLAEITANTLPLDERMSTDPKEFKKETYLRSEVCREYPSGDNYYQTGRAADDTLKILVNNGDYNLKELLFYSYVAISFYQLSMEYSQKEVPNCFIEYRIAIIYIYLYSYGGYSDNYDYNKHFLLSAEAYMRMAREDHTEDLAASINEYLPEYDYYYASVLNNFITLFQCDNERIWEQRRLSAEAYIEYAGVDDRHYDECKKYIED